MTPAELISWRNDRREKMTDLERRIRINLLLDPTKKWEFSKTAKMGRVLGKLERLGLVEVSHNPPEFWAKR
jgi:hypothetical protein